MLVICPRCGLKQDADTARISQCDEYACLGCGEVFECEEFEFEPGDNDSEE